MNVLLLVLVAVCALALVGILLSRRSRVEDDGVAEFRRQLGALSPDASRPVIRPHFDLDSNDSKSHDVNEGEHGT